MKKNITIEKIVIATNLLKDAKLTKMEDADKYKTIKAMKVLNPVSEEYNEFLDLTREKLKAENFEEMQEKARKWQAEGEKTTLTEEERIEINKFFADYQKSIEECIKEEIAKEKELDYTPLSEDAFLKLAASNPDWTMQQIMAVEEVLVFDNNETKEK